MGENLFEKMLNCFKAIWYDKENSKKPNKFYEQLIAADISQLEDLIDDNSEKYINGLKPYKVIDLLGKYQPLAVIALGRRLGEDINGYSRESIEDRNNLLARAGIAASDSPANISYRLALGWYRLAIQEEDTRDGSFQKILFCYLQSLVMYNKAKKDEVRELTAQLEL